jgi:membrane protein YdbS with pleckstrin-like domain
VAIETAYADGVDDLFEVPGVPWVGVSPALATVRHQILLASLVLVLAGLGALSLLWTGLIFAIGAPIALVAAAFGWRLVSRSAAAWAYAERDDDLFIRRGVAFRRIEVVPYGRMQLVDVTAGPLQRLHGIATVHLHTASPDTTARIHGLPPAEAKRLRDRLTARGEAQAAGL